MRWGCSPIAQPFPSPMFVWMGKISGTGAYWLMNNIIICFINDKDFVMCIILTITTYIRILKIIQHTLYIKDTLYILSIIKQL